MEFDYAGYTDAGFVKLGEAEFYQFAPVAKGYIDKYTGGVALDEDTLPELYIVCNALGDAGKRDLAGFTNGEYSERYFSGGGKTDPVEVAAVRAVTAYFPRRIWCRGVRI
ncbi:hypothetical protein FACS1894219_12760 [Clostridia bacterium]|nr:hypothetical protein FACS1894219_12760 [Clostridia bacterium]